MKKYFLFMCVALLGLFTSCQEEAPVMGGDTEVTIAVTVPEGALGTRGVVEGSARFADPAMSDMRVALIVSNEAGQVLNVYTDTHSFGEDGNSAANFKVRFVKGQKYNITAWADFGAAYYTLPAAPDASGNLSDAIITAATTRTGSMNSNDCYYKNELIQITENKTIGMALKRPVALVKVSTTDWNLNEVKYANFRPDFYQVKVTAPTHLNLVSGVADNAQEITCSAAIVEYNVDTVCKELHYDYFFANTESALLPAFTVNYYQGGDATGAIMSDYTFENIPIQRNYKTNISGNVLTKMGDINITIDNSWLTPDKEVLLYEVDENASVESVLEAKAASEASNGKGVEVVVKEFKTTSQYKGEEVYKIVIPAEVTVTNTPSVNLSVPQVPADKILYITDETIGMNEYDGKVVIKVPESVTSSKVILTTSSAHVELTGNYEIIEASTGGSTLVIAAGYVVKNVIVEKGNIDVYGEVESIVRSEDNQDALTIINLYDGAVWSNWDDEKDANQIKVIVNCGTYGFDPTGYNAEKTEVIAGEDVWIVRTISDEWKYSAAAKFSNMDEAGKVINITSAEEFALFANNVNANINYEGWTINLMNDLNMDGKKWAPIGNFTDNLMFKGTFDGQDHKIYNISVYSKDKKGVGVFGKVYAPCVIKNVNIVNATVLAEGTNTYTGGLVGHGYAKISDCSFQGTITAGNQMGGIAASGGFTITGCTFDGTINGKYWGIGGIIGNCQDGGAISNNIAKGTINGTINPAEPYFIGGGIIGCAIYTDYDIQNNYSDMIIKYNGVAQTNYPIMGVYNIDNPGTGSTAFANLLEKVANNTWNKNIYAKDSYIITYNNDNPQVTSYKLNYGGATTEIVPVEIAGKGYASLNAALAEVQDGDIIMINEFTDKPAAVGAISNVNGKTFTIKGVDKKLSIVMIGNGTAGGEGACDYRLEGANVTFENLTFAETSGNANYLGLVRPGKLMFDNCIFQGRTSYWGHDCTIENSIFEHADVYDYCLWTWGCAKMTIKNTIFNTQGKAIKMYGAGTSVLTVEGCTFNSNGQHAGADKPAIAINTGDYITDYTVYINNCVENGFVAGATGSAMFGSDLLSEVQGNLDVYVDDVLVWKDGAANTWANNPAKSFAQISEDQKTITIMSAAELGLFAKNINEGNTYSGWTIYLGADIDLADRFWETAGTEPHHFHGIFDGQNHIISHLNINNAASDANCATGLFGWLTNATIQNVKVDYATIIGHHDVGVIAGYMQSLNTCYITNCSVDHATISCTYASDDADGDKCGGIVGYAGNAGSLVSGCSISNSIIDAGRDAGQIAGAAKEANVSNCSATSVTVSANGTGSGANIQNAIIGRVL